MGSAGLNHRISRRSIGYSSPLCFRHINKDSSLSSISAISTIIIIFSRSALRGGLLHQHHEFARYPPWLWMCPSGCNQHAHRKAKPKRKEIRNCVWNLTIRQDGYYQASPPRMRYLEIISFCLSCAIMSWAALRCSIIKATAHQCQKNHQAQLRIQSTQEVIHPATASPCQFTTHQGNSASSPIFSWLIIISLINGLFYL
jgi:hypothetical protein